MKFVALFALIFIAFAGISQDQLFKKDNAKLEVKVLEINPNEIKYKLFTYQDGPTIIILKSDVAMIIYQNGTHEVFNTPAPQIQQPVIIYREDLGLRRETLRHTMDSVKRARFNELIVTKNLISFNLLEPFNGSIGVSYLREFAHNLFHVYVPVSVGVATPYFNQTQNTIFGGYSDYNGNVSEYVYSKKTIEAGLGLHFQTSGKRAVTHFIGPYIGMAQFTGSYNSNYYDPNNNNGGSYQPPVKTPHDFVMNRYTIMIDNGILIRAHKNLNMMLLAGIGYHSDTYTSNDPKNFNTGNGYNYSNTSNFPINSFKLGMSIGYRF